MLFQLVIATKMEEKVLIVMRMENVIATRNMMVSNVGNVLQHTLVFQTVDLFRRQM